MSIQNELRKIESEFFTEHNTQWSTNVLKPLTSEHNLNIVKNLVAICMRNDKFKEAMNQANATIIEAERFLIDYFKRRPGTAKAKASGRTAEKRLLDNMSQRKSRVS